MPSLTRRGWGALGVVAVLFANAFAFGGRNLNALVVPLVLAVVAAVVAIRRTDRPAVSRTVPRDGFVGETNPVELRFDVEKPLAGVVEDDHDEGVSASGNRFETTIGDQPLRYDLTYERRGLHEVGPAEVTVTDVLGLATKTFEYRETDSVLVYPRVFELTGATRSELAMLAGSALEREREEFDRIREYESGDSLRDVHWKSSAKQPADDLVVKEFVAESDAGDVTVAIEATEGNADRMAEAAASLALHFLAMGVTVGVDSPGVSIDPDAGADHRTHLLEHLARVGPGRLDGGARSRADVVVVARDDGVTVTVDGHELDFADLAGVEAEDVDAIDAGETGPEQAVATVEVMP